MLINGITIMITITVDNNDKNNNKVDKKITTTHITKKTNKMRVYLQKIKVSRHSFVRPGWVKDTEK